MKKIFSYTLLLALVFAMLASTALTASADGSVTYSGSSQKFVFAPGSDHSPTDLFDGFKGVMPGDQRTQKVTIKNDVDNNVKIALYMRALGAQEGSEEFLSQMTLSVKVTDGEELFKASADQTAGLTEWYCLGTFYSGSDVDLELVLDVPITMGNEFQNAVGLLDWEFHVEEYPISPDDPQPPGTGDTGIYLYVGLAVFSIAVMFFIIIIARRRKDEEEAEIA